MTTIPTRTELSNARKNLTIERDVVNRIFSVIVFVVLLNQVSNAQEFAHQVFLDRPAIVLSDSARADSVPPAAKRKLLPDNMSFMERGLWGERGILRGMGLASPLTPTVRKSELGLRRTMLTMHQIGGFITLGLMGTTVYFGQRTLDNSGNRSYRDAHQGFVTATIISYTATGLLAILSPPPFIRRDEVSTTTIHKTLAWVHFAGMIVTPIIGMSLRHSLNYDQLARFHQISAYITTATLAASMIIITIQRNERESGVPYRVLFSPWCCRRHRCATENSSID